MKSSQKDMNIEKAIKMVVDCVNKKNRNPKPLILHSLRVGIKLFELNQSEEVIIAGMLHDLVEDTDCRINEIQKEFGGKVSNLVLALTQNNIKDRKKRWSVLLDKIKKAGRGAMLIKIVDNNDNLVYCFPFFKGKKMKEETLWKYHFTIKSFKPYFNDNKIFKEYCKNYKLAKTNCVSCKQFNK